MSSQHFYILVVLVFATTRIHSLRISADQPTNTIHLKPPNLADIYRDNRSPWYLSSNSVIATDNSDVNPCNGSYLKTNGTTCGLREIMIGRCYEYQYVKRGLYLSNKTDIKNCTKLYELFESEVRSKSYCNMNMSTYTKYFEHALEGVQVIDRAMFWSGTYVIAHTYSAHGSNYITLEDTLAAAMVDGLSWCGKENDTGGFDYVSCPNACRDNIWADKAFWGLASKTFAERVTGEIYVVLNGSRIGEQPSFRNSSYFATFELPNLQQQGPSRVTKINVLVLHSPDLAVVERCGEKSLVILENLIRSYQFEYVCQDDPDELLLIMCGDQWGARECRVAQQALRKRWDQKVYGKSNASYLSHSVFILFSLLLVSFEHDYYSSDCESEKFVI